MQPNMDKFKIIHSKDVLIKVTKEPEIKSASGIIIDTYRGLQDRENIGVVMQKGSDVNNLEVGDKVIFTKTAGTEVTENKYYKWVLMGQDRIMGVIQD